MKNEKKQFQFIHTCALLFLLTAFAALLTWIIPAGEFDYEKVGTVNRVVSGTYHTVEQSPQGLWAVFNATVGGFTKASVLMTMIMFVGAAVYILQQTRSIELAFSKIAGGKKTNDAVVVLAIMAFMTIGGATGVFANPTVALIPIGILVTTTMGLDRASGFLMVYLGAYSGFNVGWANPSTLGIAHPIAELPVFSGLNVRIVIHIINFIISYYFVMRYFKMVRKDPTKSLNYKPGMQLGEYMGSSAMEATEGSSGEQINWKHYVNLLATFGAVGAIIFGSINYKWSNDKFAAIFLILSIFLGIFNGYGINGTTKMFLKGCSTMLGAAFIVGFANGISIILANGKILNTIVYAMSIPMTKFGSIIGANVMFIANIFINLFIPSGSGQAAAVMPIMVPVADLVGVTRQVAVQAFQFGDGFSNCLFPTAGTLMGSLGIAGVDWNKYAKWFLPMLLVQSVFAMIALTLLQGIGWTGL
ncbi:YfcC family protein [Oscillospiraceae bacterium LTW-04]|nr:Na+/H+ antiporter NhaC family protein [Oscillospiraceae bacterium MB24-C1]